MVNLHHLRVFSIVAATGGIRSASDQLHRAFSAVTRSIAALEEELDTRLFERTRLGMLITPAGTTVLARARRIELELTAVRDDAVRLAGRAGPGAVGGVDALFNEGRLMAASLLAELQHMPSAARALGMSQPAVSQTLARLEHVLGRPLFLRTVRGMAPTEVGARWILQFDRALAEARHIGADVAAMNGSIRGQVTVGALPLARTLLLPAAMTGLRLRHPDVLVRSLESPYEELCAGLLSGKVDVIVGALRPATGRDMAAELLFDDETVLVVRAGHPLAGKRNLTLDDVIRFPWVLYRHGTPLRNLLVQYFAAQGRVAPEPVVETGDLALLRGLLLQGDVVTVLSAQQVHYELQAGTLTVLPLAMPGMRRQIGLLTRSGAQLSPGAAALIREIRAAAAPLAPRQAPVRKRTPALA